jgi:ribosome maturation factor RimP
LIKKEYGGIITLCLAKLSMLHKKSGLSPLFNITDNTLKYNMFNLTENIYKVKRMVFMVGKKIEQTVEDICMPITEALGLQLIDVEYKKEGNNFVLRIIIDKPDGIMIEDCENVSHELNEKLDEIDPIESSYNLEVQSPGERSLRRDSEFEYFKGRDVEVKLYEVQEGKKVYEGKLLGMEQKIIKIVIPGGGIKEFYKEKVANIKLKITF